MKRLLATLTLADRVRSSVVTCCRRPTHCHVPKVGNSAISTLIRVSPSVSLLLLFITGCQSLGRTGSEQVATQSHRELQAEYSVYSDLLRMQRRRDRIIVADSTVPPFQGRAVFCFEPDRKPGSCLEPQEGTSVDAWKDFASKNRRSWLLHPLFEKDLDVTMVRDADLPTATCEGPTITYFSRVGFNPELTQAIVHVTTVTGKGPMPPCGHAWGERLVLQRTPTGWQAVGDNQSFWVT